MTFIDREAIDLTDDAVHQPDAGKADVAQLALVQCNGGTMRYTLEGTDPATDLGLIAFDGEVIRLEGSQVIAALKMIKLADSPIVEVEYAA